MIPSVAPVIVDGMELIELRKQTGKNQKEVARDLGTVPPFLLVPAEVVPPSYLSS